MRLGTSLTSGIGIDDHAEGARWMLQRARAANESELDSLTIGDHHAMPVAYYQNTPMLGRLMAEWDMSRPLGCLFLLPLWHPVLVAEHVGTLAAIADRRFVLQTGIGSGRDQFAAMGADLTTRGKDLEESIRVIKALLAGERTSSERFNIADASISPIPPHGVEWWIGAGAPSTLDRTAREGDAWYVGPGSTPETLRPKIDIYREACERHGTVPQIVLRQDVIILRDENRARDLGEERMAKGYRGMTSDAVVFGGVDEAVERLGRFAAIGVDEIAIRCMDIDQADALETLECAGDVRIALRSA